MASILDKLDGLAGAKLYETGTYLQMDKELGASAHFVLEVDRIVTKDTRKSGAGFIIETRVLSSSDPETDPVGSRRTVFIKMQDLDVALPNIKAFAYSVLGLDPRNPDHRTAIKEKIDPVIVPLVKGFCDEDKNPMRGKKFAVDTEVILTKQAQKKFTRHNFTVA